MWTLVPGSSSRHGGTLAPACDPRGASPRRGMEELSGSSKSCGGREKVVPKRSCGVHSAPCDGECELAGQRASGRAGRGASATAGVSEVEKGRGLTSPKAQSPAASTSLLCSDKA